MFMHDKRLQYTVRVAGPNPVTRADPGAGPGAGRTTPVEA
jgi:hypothetical protein